MHEVLEHQKWRATLPETEQKNTPRVPVKKEQGIFLFSLSPNDLVYVPTEDEVNLNLIDFKNLKKEQVHRIYKFTDFIHANVSDLLFNMNKKEQEKNGIKFPVQNEIGLGSPQSKNQNAIDGLQIKSNCLKLEIDRLGNITKLIQ